MVIAVVGGGNIGMLMAAEFAARGHELRLFTTHADAFGRRLEAFDQDDSLAFAGELALVSDDLAQVVAGARYVFVTYPTMLFPALADRLVPLIEPGQRLVAVPGANAEFAFGRVTAQGATLIGLQRVHSIARVREPGRSVYMLGRRTSGLHLASVPPSAAEACSPELSSLFELPVSALPNYLVETLTPSNPILHTTRLASLFADWRPGVSYPENFLFYEGWDDASSELLLACDDELQGLCRVLERKLGIDLGEVRSLRQHYESPTASALTAKIRSIPAFRGLTSPMRELAPGVWVPDFSSRYFKADFAHGLKAIRDIARLAQVLTPQMDEVWGWYLRASGETEFFEGVPASLEALGALYA